MRTMVFTTNSYGPMIYTSPGEDKNSKGSRHKKRRRQSAYRRLNKNYEVDRHVYVTSIDNIKAIRETMSLRLKDKVIEEMRLDLGSGYIAKLGADVYVIQSQPSTYDVFIRKGTTRKAYKRMIKASKVEPEEKFDV